MNLPQKLLQIIGEKHEFFHYRDKLFQEIPEKWVKIVVEHRLFDLFQYNMDTIQWLVNREYQDVLDWLYANYWRQWDN